ncbi:MAG: hypothetical protein HC772_06880 [Leptolyngbyaceae cyanobacterium CRU_2_3]|nr:hypothetical protein [Leptolyngbyaceae cyanobacterium CRU_2_3]
MGKHQADWRHEHYPAAQLNETSPVQPARQPPVRQTVRQKRFSGLTQFVQRYPLALLLSTWFVFMMMAGIATLSMISLEDSKLPQSPQVAASASLPAQSIPPEQPVPAIPTKHTEQQSLPLASLAAIALSCAIGSVILLQGLKPRRPTRQIRAPLPKSRVSKSNSYSAASSKSSFKFQQTVSSTSEAILSVVPPDTSHPLDWDDPSLADSLDIRRQKPLSYWL